MPEKHTQTKFEELLLQWRLQLSTDLVNITFITLNLHWTENVKSKYYQSKHKFTSKLPCFPYLLCLKTMFAKNIGFRIYITLRSEDIHEL